MIWKKCPFGCIFQTQEQAWTALKFQAMKGNAQFKCPTCGRMSPVDRFQPAQASAAVAIPDRLQATSLAAGGKKVDQLVQERMINILPGMGILESSKRQKASALYQQLIMKLMNAELTSNFPTPRIFALLASGAMKNMWHFPVPATAKDQRYAAERDAGERQMFSTLDERFKEGVAPVGAHRPIYMVLNVGNLMQGGVSAYGNSYFVYKDAVKLRCSYIATDSLQMIKGDAQKAPEARVGVGVKDLATYTTIANVLLRVTDKKLRFLCSLAGGPACEYVDEFIEAHGWGEVKLEEDLKAIVLSRPDLKAFATGKDSDDLSLFPAELHGMTMQQKEAATKSLEDQLQQFCAKNGIELHFLDLGLATKTSVAARPVKKA